MRDPGILYEMRASEVPVLAFGGGVWVNCKTDVRRRGGRLVLDDNDVELHCAVSSGIVAD